MLLTNLNQNSWFGTFNSTVCKAASFAEISKLKACSKLGQVLYESFSAIDDGSMSCVWQDTSLKKRKSNYNNTKTMKKIKKLKFSTREAALTNYAVFNNHTLV